MAAKTSLSKNMVKSGVNGAHGKLNRNAILLALPRKESDSVFKKLQWVDLPLHVRSSTRRDNRLTSDISSMQAWLPY